MKKLFLLIIFPVMFFCCGCDFALQHQGSVVVFSDKPITQGCTQDDIKTTFDKGERIFYCVYSKEPFKNNEGRIQVYKKNPKTQIYGYSLEYGNDICLKPDAHFYTGSFTLYSDGLFLLAVYLKSNPGMPLTQGTFWVAKDQ